MDQFLQNQAFVYWVYTVLVLTLKMHLSSGIQAYYRLSSKTYARAEDAKAFKAPQAKTEHPIVDICQKIWRNDLENIPLFLILGLTFVVIGGPAEYALYYFAIFTIVRVLHTCVYLKLLQPYRLTLYLIGLITTFVMLGHIVMLVCDFR